MREHNGFSTREKLRYRLDNLLGRGTAGMVGLLGLVVAIFIVIATVVFLVLRVSDSEGERITVLEGLWISLMRVMDPGAVGGDVGWKLRLISLVITIIGIFLVSILIGILVTGLDSRLAELQRGRGRIAVAGHTLILGWSSKVFTILSELAIANESNRGATVVILADEDKLTMDDLIATRLAGRELHGLTIVTRNGEPQEASDLAIVNPGLAKSIIVLGADSTAGDSGVVKTVLALVNQVGVSDQVPIVAEIHSGARARTLRSITHGRVVVVEPWQVVARTAAQASREGGLNVVFKDLFDFDGDEIYFAQTPQAQGLSFGEVLTGYPTSTVIGVRTAAGEVLMHPSLDRVIEAGDAVILIAADDSATSWSGPMPGGTPDPEWAADVEQPRGSERMLLFGWNPSARTIVAELDEYIGPDSSLTIVVDPLLVTPEEIDLPAEFTNLTVDVRFISEINDPIGTVLSDVDCDSIMILCYRGDAIDAKEAGGRTLMMYLETRDVLRRLGRTSNVTAELLDERDVDLVPAASDLEFVMSERLASLLMAQLSENIELDAVFSYLFSPEGSEIYFKDCRRYTRLGVEVTFADLVEAAKARGEIALGWRVTHADDPSTATSGVVLNPPKSTTVAFSDGDQVIVLAETDS